MWHREPTYKYLSDKKISSFMSEDVCNLFFTLRVLNLHLRMVALTFLLPKFRILCCKTKEYCIIPC